MTRRLALYSSVLAFCAALTPLVSAEDGGTPSAALLAEHAVDADRSIAEPAIVALRALGREGHAALMARHATAIGALRTHAASDASTSRLRHAIDRVSGQRDGHWSGLYFHTDLAAALAEAHATGKPVLSLRLLGRLDEEMSCANSRFFRILLYPAADVREALSTRFVLHWSMERPAPRITIDMGDGRRIERTITGNSIHYVLDARGRVIDAIPGLYDHASFVAALDRAEAIVRACGAARGAQFGRCMQREHDAASTAIARRWSEVNGGPMPTLLSSSLVPVRPAGAFPSAANAMPLTVGKAVIEMPMIQALARAPSPAPLDPIMWQVLVGEVPALDPASVALMRAKLGREDVDALAARWASIAATDALRNEVLFHDPIHRWLASDVAMTDFERINERVYTELFQTPASDPWLGLDDPSMFDGLERRTE